MKQMRSVVLTALWALLGALSVMPSLASAQWNITVIESPWKDSPVSITMGKANNTVQVCFTEQVAPYRSSLYNLNTDRLQTVPFIIAGNKNDGFQVAGNGWAVSGCGVNFSTFSSNGYTIIADLGAGNDASILSGNLYATVGGGSGDDSLLGGWQLYGGPGSDRILAGWQTDNAVHGEDGDDCLNDLNNQAATYSCGTGTDKHEYSDGAIIAVLGVTDCEPGAQNAPAGCIQGWDY